MKKISKLLPVLLTLCLLLSGCDGGSTSETEKTDVLAEYPNQTINVIIPYAASSDVSIQARLLGEYFSEKLGYGFTVNSKPGGAGAVGMNEAKRAKPDGHTIILTAIGPCVLTPNYSDVGYNTLEDFEPICQYTFQPYILSVPNKSPYATLEEFMKYVEEHPGEMIIGLPGAGLHQHVSMTAFFGDLGLDVELIPFDTGIEAVTALVGGHVDATVTIGSNVRAFFESGDIRLLGVTSEETFEDFPETPTFKESGFDLVTGAWFGFLAPKGTPTEIVELLDQTFYEALNDEKIVAQFKKSKYIIDYLDREAFTELIKTDWDLYKKIIEERGLSNQ